MPFERAESPRLAQTVLRSGSLAGVKSGGYGFLLLLGFGLLRWLLLCWVLLGRSSASAKSTTTRNGVPDEQYERAASAGTSDCSRGNREPLLPLDSRIYRSLFFFKNSPAHGHKPELEEYHHGGASSKVPPFPYSTHHGGG